MENKKCVISMSGGLDSTSLALYMLSQGYEIRAYGFNYGQKHDVELNLVKKNIAYLQSKGHPIEFQTIDLRDAFSDSSSSLHKGGDAIPEGDYQDETMKSTVVENRNIIFSSIIYGKALAWANKTQSNVVITLGLHAGDHTIYPDCRPESQEMARELFRISNWGSERVDYVAPFIKIDKGTVLKKGIESCVKLGIDWKVIYSNTISCYNPDEVGRSCGKCGTCVERIEAFEKLGLKDPIAYQDTPLTEHKFMLQMCDRDHIVIGVTSIKVKSLNPIKEVVFDNLQYDEEFIRNAGTLLHESHSIDPEIIMACVTGTKEDNFTSMTIARI